MDVTTEQLAARIGDPGLALLDVRTHDEFTGAGGYPCDPRQGHIPGARHLDVRKLVGATNEEIRELVGLPEGLELVAYCHSGQRSATAVELLRAAGYDARNYAGSWHEWSRRDELPIER
ncbi:MAG: rhodanese-like domain-containing protein [Actinomycetota bacterium]|nr:rhodanese-like domain-containing protein [Actinomycetota bacterium]